AFVLFSVHRAARPCVTDLTQRSASGRKVPDLQGVHGSTSGRGRASRGRIFGRPTHSLEKKTSSCTDVVLELRPLQTEVAGARPIRPGGVAPRKGRTSSRQLK